MIARRQVEHRHSPIYRVVRSNWANPLDASFSRERGDRRWNTDEFAVLYCCCSERVARAVALDLFRMAGVGLDELQPDYQPQLVELGWSGSVVDIASSEGILAAGFPDEYPKSADRSSTRKAGVEWHASGEEGVVCRSASLARMGFRTWSGSHEPWGEVAIFVENTREAPRLLVRREGLSWLKGQAAGSGAQAGDEMEPEVEE